MISGVKINLALLNIYDVESFSQYIFFVRFNLYISNILYMVVVLEIIVEEQNNTK